MAVSKRLRYEVLRRDNHACRYCGATAPDVKLNVDHVIPKSLGGTDTPSNLVTSCAACNAGKTSSMPNAMPVADVDQETFRQATALRQEADKRRLAAFVHLYMVWTWAWKRTGQPLTDRDESYFAEETHTLLDCGAAANADLTEAAFRAGSLNDVYVAAYINRESPTDIRFVTCVDAINAWETAWDFVSNEGTPASEVVSRFVNDVGAAYDAAVDPGDLIRAAAAAGSAMSADLGKHLSNLVATGGEN